MRAGDRVKHDGTHFLFGRFTIWGTVTKSGKYVKLDKPLPDGRQRVRLTEGWVLASEETAGERYERLQREAAEREEREWEERQRRVLELARATGRQVNCPLEEIPVGTLLKRFHPDGTFELWEVCQPRTKATGAFGIRFGDPHRSVRCLGNRAEEYAYADPEDVEAVGMVCQQCGRQGEPDGRLDATGVSSQCPDCGWVFDE